MWALQFFSTQWSGPACHGRARCHGHGGQIYVAESPWTVKASPEGVVTLDDVPEGAVSVKVWHALHLACIAVGGARTSNACCGCHTRQIDGSGRRGAAQTPTLNVFSDSAYR